MERQESQETLDSDRHEETDTLMAIITVSLKELNLLSAEELEQRLGEVPRQYALLLETMGEFTVKSCGNLNKLYEATVVPALRDNYEEKDYDIRHVKHSYGTDLVVTHRRTREEFGIDVKHSVVCASKKYRSNWCFELSLKAVKACYKETDVVKRAELVNSLVQSVQRRMPNGFALFIARYGDEKLAHYMVSGNFIAYYCVTKALRANSYNVNLGSARCTTCGHYHRMLHLAKYGVLLAKRVEEQTGGVFIFQHPYFSEDEVALIFNGVQNSQCSAQ